jgi:N-acetylneuraminic acid mutarotase
MKKTAATMTLVLVFLVATFLAELNHVSGAAVTENFWTAKAPMSEAKNLFGIEVVNGKIYVLGGLTFSGTNGIRNGYFGTGGVVGTNAEYDPLLDIWILKKPMPAPRYNFATVVVKNKIYCIGGAIDRPKYGSATLTKAVEVYDPATNMWEVKTPMPYRRENFILATYQDRIYLIGGTAMNYTSGNPVYSLNEVYNPATDTWETRAPMPSHHWSAANVVNGKFYILADNATYVYDPAADNWTTKAPMPAGAYDVISTVVNEKIYVFSFVSYGVNTKLTRIYNTKVDEWKLGSPPPNINISRAVVTTGVFAPKKIYILDDAIYVYDPANDKWKVGANLPTDRDAYKVAVVNDVLYAIGGAIYTSSPSPPELVWDGPITHIKPQANNEAYTPFGYGTIPPNVSVISPEYNRTYAVGNVSLIFELNKPVAWVGYSLDGHEIVNLTNNTVIVELPNGVHNVTVYANDTFGNMGKSEIISFSVEKPTEPFPLVPIAVAVVVAFVGVGLLVYFKKRKH